MDISKYRIDLPKLPSKALQMTLLWHAWKGVSQIGPSPATYSGKFHHGDAADRGWVSCMAALAATSDRSF